MKKILINPTSIEEEYLECLNKCFNNWGDIKKFDWYFKSKSSFPSTDLIVITQDGKIASGSAVSYRYIKLPNRKKKLAGIMTGSWTLPEYRKCGFFTDIIEKSIEITRNKSGEYLLAYVTSENSSRRQIEKTGAVLFPTKYVFSTGKNLPNYDYQNLISLQKTTSNVKKIYELLLRRNNVYTHFLYDSDKIFANQFLNRPNKTEILTDGKNNFIIAERTTNTDAILLCLAEKFEHKLDLIESFYKRSLLKKRKFFCFSTDEKTVKALRSIGLETKRGFLTMLPTSSDLREAEKIENLKWKIHNGDRL